MTDNSALLESAEKPDRDGFTAIFDKYAPAIYKYALCLCHNHIESDDIVGDVFSLLLEQWVPGKDSTANLRAHLYQIAYRVIVDRTRRNKRTVAIEAISEKFVPVMPLQKNRVEEHTLIDALVFALNSDLHEEERHVIILRFLEDFSPLETAAIVGRSLEYVKGMQKSGIAKLRKLSHSQVQDDHAESTLSRENGQSATNLKVS